MSGYERDFIDVFPRLCVVCTSLPKSEFSSGASANWVTGNSGCVLGGHLGMSTADEVKALIERYKQKNSFSVQLMCEVPRSVLLSREVEDYASGYLKQLDLDSSKYRVTTMAMMDIFGKTSEVVFCWFLPR